MPVIDNAELRTFLAAKIDMKILEAKCPICNHALHKLETRYNDTVGVQAIDVIHLIFKCGMKINRELQANEYKIAAKCENANNLMLQQKMDQVSAKTDTVEINRFTELK